MNAKLRNNLNSKSSNSPLLNTSRDHSTSLKQERKRRLIRSTLIALGAIFVIVIAFFIGAERERALKTSVPVGKSEIGEKMKLEMHWHGEPITLNKYNDPDGDVCNILADCFKSHYFRPDPIKFPDNPLNPCHRTLKNILNSFDSGFYFDGPRVVGFVSSELKRDREQGFISINVYNVCIRREDRGKGVAKAMMSDYIKAVTEKQVPAGSKTYIGLDVDFDTESAVAAFAMYAKMGFNRWWEPCKSIAYFDYKVMERQFLLANPELDTANPARQDQPAFLFPMSQLMLRRKDSLQKQIIQSGRNKVLTHFCMVMLLGADDFGTVGKDIKDSVESALK